MPPPRRLCRCSAGWAGQGTVCDECVRPLEPDAGSRCCLCPPNQRLARPESQPDGAHQCYRCHGKGCLHQNCENRNDCSKGYKGTLCSYCADDYYWSAGICKECHVKRSQASWAPLIVLKYLGLALLVASLTFVVVHFAARKGDPKSKFDQGLRSAELMEQALLLLTFLQLMKTVNSVNAIDHLNGEDEGEDTDHVGSALWKVIQLRIGDVLDYCFRPECDLGYIAGHQLERLSSAFLLPFLCVLVLSAGACRGSPFYALRFCIIVVSALFPGTIEVTLSNLICIDADEGKLPLEEMSFLRGMPFVKCDDWSEYHYLQVTMRLAVLVNAVFLPGALLALGWSINRQVAPFWSSCSWQKPSFGLDASFEAITLRFDASGVKREGRESLGAALSPLLWTETSYLRICMASHLACLAEAVASAEPLQVEMMAPEDGKESMTFTCSATDQWRRLTVQQQEHCLRDARSYAIGLSETFLYRHVARAALMEGNLESLWLGARNTFERFSVSDPLLFVGGQRVRVQVAVAAITALCVKKDLATLGTTFLLLAIGLFRGKPFGSRSRNQLGFICYLSLAAFSFVLYLFGKGRHTWAIFLIVPLGFFLHLQMMQGDVMLQAYKLLEDLPNTEQRAWTRSARLFHVTPVVWHSETTKSWVRRLFETYRHHARTLTVKGGGLLLRLEDLLLRGLRRLLSASTLLPRMKRPAAALGTAQHASGAASGVQKPTAVVTGAGSGIGRALSVLLASKGLHVLAVGRRPKALQETCELVTNVEAVPADVGTTEGRQLVAQRVAELCQGGTALSCVVHNAAVTGEAAGLVGDVGSVAQVTEEDFSKTMAINVEGPLFLTRELLPLLLESKGRVLHISSGAAHRPLEGCLTYCTSKAALLQIMRCLDEAHVKRDLGTGIDLSELAPQGVRVGSAMPGVVDTPMQTHLRSQNFSGARFFRGLAPAEGAWDRPASPVRGGLDHPENVAAFMSWLLLEVPGQDFGGREWNIGDPETQRRWLSTVAGCASVNGRYAHDGLGPAGKVKYKKVDGDPVIYFSRGQWRLNDEEGTDGWSYFCRAETDMPPLNDWESISVPRFPPAPCLSWGTARDLLEGDSVTIVKNDGDAFLQMEGSHPGTSFCGVDVDWSNCPEEDEPIRRLRFSAPWVVQVSRLRDGAWFYPTIFESKIAPLTALGFVELRGKKHVISDGAGSSSGEDAPPFLVVTGAGHPTVNGRYFRAGLHQRKPKYKQVGGNSIIFFESRLWRLNDEEDTNTRCYDGPEDDSPMPPLEWVQLGTSRYGAAPSLSLGTSHDLREGDSVLFGSHSEAFLHRPVALPELARCSAPRPAPTKEAADWSGCPLAPEQRLPFTPGQHGLVKRVHHDWLYVETDSVEKVAPLKTVKMVIFMERQHRISEGLGLF
eukprot:g6284.t1